jgi:HD-GYP domain-containing protein (c-di-GMP phosphodiesterase class II)
MPRYKLKRNILTAFFIRTGLVIVLVAVCVALFFYYFELYNFKQDIATRFRINAWDIFKHRQYLSNEHDIHDIQQYMDSRIRLDKDIEKLAVYDENLRLIYDTVRPDFPLAAFLEAHRNSSPLSREMNAIEVSVVNHEGSTYLWIASPIINLSEVIIGYAEAIKKADAEAMTHYQQRRFFSIAAGIFFVLLLALALFPLFLRAYRDLKENEKLLLASNLSTIKYLGDAIALRDSETSLHNFRVTLYAIALGEEIGLTSDRMRSLIKGAFLHDIGKIGITDNILLKAGSLTEEEFDIMKTHVDLGSQIVGKDAWFRDALEVIAFHHEKYEGTGYPTGAKQEEIPLNARIFAIVDVFDALTSDRPYRAALRLEKAHEILQDGAGTHFDTELLHTFLKISPELYRDIAHLDKEVLERLLREKVEYYFL